MLRYKTWNFLIFIRKLGVFGLPSYCLERGIHSVVNLWVSCPRHIEFGLPNARVASGQHKPSNGALDGGGGVPMSYVDLKNGLVPCHLGKSHVTSVT